MNATWIFPFIILGGALQTCGAAMNAQLFQSLQNKWLANAVSFAPIMASAQAIEGSHSIFVPVQFASGQTAAQ